jgi:excisionase family DNA binding protein
MTKPYSYQKWQTARVWPGGGWGEALAQVRKDQRLTQHDVADFVGVRLATLRRWEHGKALPDRSLWSKLEEAMGVPVPDPRVPDHTPAERELIDTMLLMTDELRLLRERLENSVLAGAETPHSQSDEPKLVDVDNAAAYFGVPVSFIRRLVDERRLVHYKIGRRVMFQHEDIDRFIEESRRELSDYIPWQLRGKRSPRSQR